MEIGLIDVDGEKPHGKKYPNLALMKISAWHKSQGDNVEWWNGFKHYNRIYMARVFDPTYTPDPLDPVNGDEIIHGGTGYGIDNRLPDEIEHTCPDYGIYGVTDTAYGFLTRGCPRHCAFCIVGDKEGLRSRKVADLSEWWSGQKNIVLMDPNLLACPHHIELLNQLRDSGAHVDVNQGFDARILTEENISEINSVRLSEIHFAWDFMEQSDSVLRGLELYRRMATRKPHGEWAQVYILTNYDTTMDENLYRVYKLRDMGYGPYVMIYDKPRASEEIRKLQRWCNNKWIFKSCPKFESYRDVRT